MSILGVGGSTLAGVGGDLSSLLQVGGSSGGSSAASSGPAAYATMATTRSS